jgi:hypothetical protein
MYNAVSNPRGKAISMAQKDTNSQSTTNDIRLKLTSDCKPPVTGVGKKASLAMNPTTTTKMAIVSIAMNRSSISILRSTICEQPRSNTKPRLPEVALLSMAI